MKNSFNKTKKFFEKYERILVPGTLVLGVLVDFVTFKNIQLKTAFIILFVYLFTAGLAITFINIYEDKLKQKQSIILRYLRLATPLVIQFTFGALLSASLIFYWFSGSFSVSWPIILIIAILMASNDVLRHYYLKPLVQISVYFFILFSIGSLILPNILNSIDAGIFILAGLTSLILIIGYILILSKYLISIKKLRFHLFFTISIIFIFINGLYFLNIIPPIPLSLREAGVYHLVEQQAESYILIDEKKTFWEKFLSGSTIHIEAGQRIYIYSSIFAPANLKTTITHEWQFYNSEQRKWITKSMPSFSIIGGRNDGYRGYSFLTNPKSGKWRVLVQTKRGQVIGRINFRVEIIETTPVLVEVFK